MNRGLLGLPFANLPGLIGVRSFSSGSGFYNKSPGTRKIIAIGTGGGGAGNNTGAGGGAGGTFITFKDMTGVDRLSYSVGANASSTTLGVSGVDGSASAGIVGAGGGGGGAATVGTVKITGGAGMTPTYDGGSGSSIIPGNGGASFWGGQGAPGSGGYGSGNGTAGILVIFEFG